MSNRILKLISVFLIAISVGLTVCADESLIGEIVIENETDGTIETTDGKIEFYFEPNGYVTKRRIFTAVILKYGVNAENFYNDESTDKIAAIMQSHLENGKVSFSANIKDEPSGMHTIAVSYRGAKDGGFEKIREFKYINPEKLDDVTVDIVSRVNLAIEENNAEKIAAILKTEADIKSITELYGERILNATEKAIKKAAETILKNKPFKQADGQIFYEDTERFAKSVNYAFAVAELNTAETSEQVKNALDFYNEKYYKIDIDFTGKDENEILSFVCGNSVEKPEDAGSVFKYAEIKSVIMHTNYSLTWQTLKDCTGDIDGINMSKFNAVNKKENFGRHVLSGIENCTDLPAIAKLVNSYSEKSGGGSGGGGGTGKSTASSVGNSVSISAPLVSDIRTTQDETPLFSDITKEHWAYKGIEYLYGKGAVKGYKDGTFAGDGAVTRAEFVTMAVKLFGLPATEELDLSFNDISENDWFFESVKTAVAARIIFGDDKGNFNPEREITRQEIAVILNRYIESTAKNLKNVNSVTVFEDADDIANWAFESVMKLCRKGIVNGTDGGNFKPENGASRAEAAVMLYRLVTAEEIVNEE